MLTYHESSWAVQRWDWFNEGRVIKPLSYCQFWRTTLLYASIKWMLAPFMAVVRAVPVIPTPNFQLPRFVGQLAALPFKGAWFAARLAAKLAWTAAYPLRLVTKVVGGSALGVVVNTGETIEEFYQEHKEGMDNLGTAFLVLLFAVYVIGGVTLLMLASWFWTLIGLGVLIVGAFTAYGVVKSGIFPAIFGLLWQAGGAAHHGICPPVTITRGE